MRIGEVCKRAQVSKELVRHYESLGLISSTPIPAGNREYRDFAPETLERLYLIQKAKRLGMTLKQIKPLLNAFMNDKMSKQQALTLLQAQYAQMEQVIQNAKEVQAMISHSIDKINNPQIATCGQGFIEKLTSSTS